MADTETVRKRLEKQILKTNHSFREISLKIGRTDAYIQQYIKYGFPKRLSEVDRKRVCEILDMNEKDLIDDELSDKVVSPLVSNPKSNNTQSQDYIMVDIYSPRPNVDFYDSIIGRVTLNSKEFSGWCGATPKSLRIIRVNGDYMEPALPSGSLILYDSNTNTYRGDGIYVVTTNNITQVKRVQQTHPDTYILINDNKNYQNISCQNPDLEILGRAICCLSSRAL